MTRCVAILGGSFDPIHVGHVALAEIFLKRLQPDEFRVMPAGNPWQKGGLAALPEQRVVMIRRAFAEKALPVVIDEREIKREGATYTIDTLRELRDELGTQASLVFILGADQLEKLDSWRDWQQLFDYAHLCVGARPGYSMEAAKLPEAVANEFALRAGTFEQIRNTPKGLCLLLDDLAVDVSATEIRAGLLRGERPQSWVPQAVLDYIDEFHLYRN